MNRRELLCSSAAGLAGVAVLGIFPKIAAAGQSVRDLHAVVGPKIDGAGSAWKEDHLTTNRVKRWVTPKLQTVKDEQSVWALTPDGWFSLASDFRLIADRYSWLGDLRLLDLGILVHQAKLRRRFDSKPVDYLLKHGTHEAMTQMSRAFLKHPGARQRALDAAVRAGRISLEVRIGEFALLGAAADVSAVTLTIIEADALLITPLAIVGPTLALASVDAFAGPRRRPSLCRYRQRPA